MAQKLMQGDRLPGLTLRLIDGGTLELPTALPGRYLALLFYRGHWCPYCRRQLQSYQANLEELSNLGVTVVAASVDSLEDTKAMAEAAGLTFPIAYGVTDAGLEAFAPWFADDQHGHYVQPMELLILRGGIIFGAMYATGPIGRMAVDEVLYSVRGRERRRLEREAEEAAGTATEPSR